MDYKNIEKYLDLIDYIKRIHIEDEYKKQLLYSIDKICEKVEGIGYDNGYDVGYYNGYDDGDNDGYYSGYDKGYEEGYAKGRDEDEDE